MVQLLIVVDSHIQLIFNKLMRKKLLFVFSLLALGLAACNNPDTSSTSNDNVNPTSVPEIIIGDESSTTTPSSSVEPTTSTNTTDDSNLATSSTSTNTSTSSDGINWDPTIIWP